MLEVASEEGCQRPSSATYRSGLLGTVMPPAGQASLDLTILLMADEVRKPELFRRRNVVVPHGWKIGLCKAAVLWVVYRDR